jgi:hypothetical protein
MRPPCAHAPGDARATTRTPNRATEVAVGDMRSLDFPDVPPGIFGGTAMGLPIADTVNRANEHFKKMAAELVDDLQETLDVMYAEAAHLQAAARVATEGDPS